MMKSRENVDQMRKFFTNDMSRFEERLKKLLRSYFQLARNHIAPRVKEEVSCCMAYSPWYFRPKNRVLILTHYR